MDFKNLFEKILLSPEAQINDAIVSPTLPVDPSIQRSSITATTSPLPTQGEGISASITSENLEGSDLGSVFDANVVIASNSTQIKSLKFSINFNNVKLRVEKIEYIDTYFTVDSSSIFNNDTGVITIKGTASSDPRTINRPIATISLKVLASGPSTISINESSSYMLNALGQNVLNTYNNLQVEVGTDSQTITGTRIPSYKEIPKSDLNSIKVYTPAIAGLIITLLGAWLFSLRKKHHEPF